MTSEIHFVDGFMKTASFFSSGEARDTVEYRMQENRSYPRPSSVLCESFDGGKNVSIKVLKHTEYTPKMFLLEYPRGAYTTTRTVHQEALFDFEGHIHRLGR
jgi:hypothetical protein